MLKARCHFQRHMTYLSSFRTFAGEQLHTARCQSEMHQLHLSISVQNCHPASCPPGCQAAALPAPLALHGRKPEQQAIVIVFLRTTLFHQVSSHLSSPRTFPAFPHFLYRSGSFHPLFHWLIRKSQAKNNIAPVLPSQVPNTQIQHWITAIFQIIKGLITNKRFKNNKQQHKLQPQLHDMISVLNNHRLKPDPGTVWLVQRLVKNEP